MNEREVKAYWDRFYGNCKIAERCGWKRAKGPLYPSCVDTWMWYKPDEELDNRMKVFIGRTNLADSTELDKNPPNYFEDLNAIHEAEKKLTEEEFSKYCAELHKFCPLKCSSPTCGYAISATAEQRFKAYLKVI